MFLPPHMSVSSQHPVTYKFAHKYVYYTIDMYVKLRFFFYFISAFQKSIEYMSNKPNSKDQYKINWQKTNQQKSTALLFVIVIIILPTDSLY